MMKLKVNPIVVAGEIIVNNQMIHGLCILNRKSKKQEIGNYKNHNKINNKNHNKINNPNQILFNQIIYTYWKPNNNHYQIYRKI
jgi:hypothetical protein